MSERAFDFAPECGDGFGAKVLVTGREINEVVIVNRRAAGDRISRGPFSAAVRLRASGRPARHMRGLAEKIWNVFAPRRAAVRAAFSSEPEMEV